MLLFGNFIKNLAPNLKFQMKAKFPEIRAHFLGTFYWSRAVERETFAIKFHSERNLVSLSGVKWWPGRAVFRIQIYGQRTFVRPVGNHQLRNRSDWCLLSGEKLLTGEKVTFSDKLPLGRSTWELSGPLQRAPESRPNEWRPESSRKTHLRHRPRRKSDAAADKDLTQ